MIRLFRATGMAASPQGKRAELQSWLAREKPARIGEAEWAPLSIALAPISPGYLRRLLRESGVPLDPVIEGVRQENFEVLEASLLRLLEEYPREGVRKLVIAAKDHARW